MANSLESNGQWLLGSSQAPHKNTFVLGVINQSCPNLFFEALKLYEVELLISGVFFLGSHPSILQEPRHNGPIVEDFGDHQVLSPGSFFSLIAMKIVGSAMCWKIRLYYTLAWAPAQNTGFHEDFSQGSG